MCYVLSFISRKSHTDLKLIFVLENIDGFSNCILPSLIARLPVIIHKVFISIKSPWGVSLILMWLSLKAKNDPVRVLLLLFFQSLWFFTGHTNKKEKLYLFLICMPFISFSCLIFLASSLRCKESWTPNPKYSGF